MAGQDKIVISNDPARVALTARCALQYAERAYAEGRISDAERLIEIAYLIFDAAYGNASPATTGQQPADKKRLVEP